MELKLGSVMLLLSCSLQQSLWGILASVPQTNANKCKNKISSEGAPTKRVQMIRRIPARCSGWDEAWSWISNKDCRTKYILDYVELPSAVQKVDPEDCEEEVAQKTKNGDLNMADEKYLAIAFGSATVALLVLIVIIVISVVRRGHNRCRMCSSGPAYSSANATEREHLEGRHSGRNAYVDDELKLAEPMYEEIHDQSTAMKKLEFQDDTKPIRYQNVAEEEGGEKSDVKNLPVNGVHRRPVTPSAPYEEELQQTNRKCVPNDYTVFTDRLVQNSENINPVVPDITSENVTDMADSDYNEDFKSDDVDNGQVEKEETLADTTKNVEILDNSELPSDRVHSPKHAADNMEDKISQKSSHSYENLHKSQTPSGEYDCIVMKDFNTNSAKLQEQTGDQCLNSASATVLNGDRTYVECVNAEDMSMPVKLASLPASEENNIHVKSDEGSDNLTGSVNISATKQETGNNDSLDQNAEVCV